MALGEYLSTGWRKFLDGLRSDDRRRLLDFLREEYLDEVKDAAQFEAHAERMIYPQFRERLQRIAQEEKAHVEWLRNKILALGGELPQRSVLNIEKAGNAWENLLIDVDEEKRDAVHVLTRLYTVAERVDPEIAAGLRRMHEEETRHRDEITQMLMRSDPQAFSTTPNPGVSERKK